MAVVGEIRRLLNDAAAAANANGTDPARRVARGICILIRSAVDDPEGATALDRIQSGYLALDGINHRPIFGHISARLANGRFAVPMLESGSMLVIGVAQIALLRIIQEPGLALAAAKARQMVRLMLRGLGVGADEAARIAAQVADEDVRAGLPSPEM